jgi:hypothetical protein
VIFLNSVHKIIAVYGNSGSYKTSTSVKLAKAIAGRDNRLRVAVVGLDHTKPLIPLLFPETNTAQSLGKLFSCECLDQEIVLSQMNMHGNIGFIGYNSGENVKSYAFPTDERIDDFLMQMRHLVDYTIIDCTHDTSYKPTSKALINADIVLYLITCDINGLVFHQSQEPRLLAEQYNYSSFLRCLSISGKYVHDEETMQNAIGEIEAIIPYSEEIPMRWNQGEGLSPMNDMRYINTIVAIADELTEV